MVDCIRRKYTVGEKRVLEWQIMPNHPRDIIVVTDARYEVVSGGAVVDSGKMTVDGLKVSCIFDASEEGSFVFRIFVTVPPETVETELHIDVMR